MGTTASCTVRVGEDDNAIVYLTAEDRSYSLPAPSSLRPVTAPADVRIHLSSLLGAGAISSDEDGLGRVTAGLPVGRRSLLVIELLVIHTNAQSNGAMTNDPRSLDDA